MSKPILCLDFDGVIHSYKSGWKGADVISDPPVDGAIAFILKAIDHFDVQVFSSRSNEPGGIEAMQKWLARHWEGCQQDPRVDSLSLTRTLIKWPTDKPPAFVTIDDRAITFNGTFPSIQEIKEFRPWNKR